MGTVPSYTPIGATTSAGYSAVQSSTQQLAVVDISSNTAQALASEENMTDKSRDSSKPKSCSNSNVYFINLNNINKFIHCFMDGYFELLTLFFDIRHCGECGSFSCVGVLFIFQKVKCYKVNRLSVKVSIGKYIKRGGGQANFL